MGRKFITKNQSPLPSYELVTSIYGGPKTGLDSAPRWQLGRPVRKRTVKAIHQVMLILEYQVSFSGHREHLKGASSL